MFVQIIEGKVRDPEGLRRMADRWQTEVRPGAVGYLGVTAGVTTDGRGISVVRFASEAAARANSARPEQSAWWAEMAACWEGDVSFTESSDVQQLLAGGSDDAGFVQVMKSADVDRARIDGLDEVFSQFAHLRPDLLGSLRIWTGPRSCVEVAYFTSEAEARAGEAVELPAELQAKMGDFEEMMANTEFIDLPDPMLH